MTEVTQALNEVRELYARFLGQPVPELPSGSYAPFPPGTDPVRFAVQEVEDLKRLLAQARAFPAPVAWIPRADVHAGRNLLLIRLEVPGIVREQLKVLTVSGECIVRGERQAAKLEGEVRPIGLELPFGTFERRFPLPPQADTESLSAKCVDGILELRIPFADVAEPKETKVEIK
jgi:HSP20 family protein